MAATKKGTAKKTTSAAKAVKPPAEAKPKGRSPWDDFKVICTKGSLGDYVDKDYNPFMINRLASMKSLGALAVADFLNEVQPISKRSHFLAMYEFCPRESGFVQWVKGSASEPKETIEAFMTTYGVNEDTALNYISIVREIQGEVAVTAVVERAAFLR